MLRHNAHNQDMHKHLQPLAVPCIDLYPDCILHHSALCISQRLLQDFHDNKAAASGMGSTLMVCLLIKDTEESLLLRTAWLIRLACCCYWLQALPMARIDPSAAGARDPCAAVLQHIARLHT
jgi:hypothetical protein